MNKKRMLVVVDMQNDFIDGPLGSEDAKAVVDKVCEKIDGWDGHVCFTMDTHYDDYPETIEGKHISIPHCVDATEGWQLNPEVEKRHDAKSFTVYKSAFGSEELANIVSYLDIEEVQLVGVCTDICVVSNALLLRSRLPYVAVSVDSSCCAGTTPENHDAALRVMRQCCVDVM